MSNIDYMTLIYIIATHETGHTRQTEATIYLGSGIGTGVAIVILFLFVVMVVVWWKKIKKLKQRYYSHNTIHVSDYSHVIPQVVQFQYMQTTRSK